MRFSRSDAAVSAAALLGAAVLLYLFAMDINAVSGRSGGTELGTVVFKRLMATRKASTGLGWERMRNNSPVYNGDTLRTASFSEATVYFDDGTSLDMRENSMLKLDFSGADRNLEFLSGSINLGSESKETNYTISSTAGTIAIGSGSKAAVRRDADTLSVEVVKGKASLLKADGSVQDVEQYQEITVDVKSGRTTIVDRPIVPVSPEPGARLLSFSSGPENQGEREARVAFGWMSSGQVPRSGVAGRSDSDFTLELSRTADFTEKTRTSTVATSAILSLAPGTWYWRVIDEDGNQSPLRRFSLDLADAPIPAFPPDENRYQYRSIKPSIGFGWSAMDEATSYLFEVAPDPDFVAPMLRLRTTTTNLSVDSLGEGLWYWRVTPLHSYSIIGSPPKIKANSIRIAKSPAMAAPKLTAPFDGSLYQIQAVDGVGLSFSWEPVDEAVAYELVVSASPDLAAPLVRVEATNPYATLDGEVAGVLKRPGSYYWSLRWKDREGNLSPTSPSHSLTGIDGSIAIRLTFPPEGYRVADSLVAATRFGWKSNVPTRADFQLARDPSFDDIVFQEPVTADNIIGRAWERGRYYWRLRAFNDDGSAFLTTKHRSFDIVNPFEAPTIVSPGPGAELFLMEHDSTILSWMPVDHADYYTVTLRTAADGYSSKVFESDFVEAHELSYPLGNLPSGAYRLSVQAFASSGALTTRIIGYIGDANFNFNRLNYIRLEKPALGDHLAGLDAKRGKIIFSYNSQAAPDEATILISKDSQGKNVVARAPNRSGKAKVGKLYPGTYYWTAVGKLAGFDISARDRLRFTVDEPPPLPAPDLIAPAQAEILGVDRLRALKRLDFSWQAVPGATNYDFAVYLNGRNDPILARSGLVDTSLAIDDLSILDRGTLFWTVMARAYDAAGELERSGETATGTFGIDLPPLQQAKSGASGRMYGR